MEDNFYQGILVPILKILAFMLPYALIPLTFKFAGGIFATFTGMVDNKGKGLFDRAKQGRAHKLERTKNERMFQNAPEGSWRSRANMLGAGTMNANKAGYNPKKWKRNMSRTLSDHSLHQRDAMLEDADYTWKGNDGLNMAAAEANNEADLRRLLTASGNYTGPDGRANMERDISRVDGMKRKYGDSAFRQASFLQAVAGGTAYGGSADVWQAAARVAGGDDAVLTDLVAKGRSAAMGAGRVDQGGAGFGETLGLAKQFRSNPNFDLEQANLEHTKRVIASQGPDTIAHQSMKQDAIRNLAPALRERVADAVAGGDELEISQALAATSGLLDAMARSNPDKVNLLADAVMGHGVEVAGDDGTVRDVTVRELTEEYKSKPAYIHARREYGQDTEAFATVRTRMDPQQQGPPGGGPPLQPPTSLPPSPF